MQPRTFLKAVKLLDRRIEKLQVNHACGLQGTGEKRSGENRYARRRENSRMIFVYCPLAWIFSVAKI